MPGRPRVVVDPNIWIRALFSPATLDLVRRLVRAECVLVVSRDSLLELKDVMERPRLRKRVKDEHRIELIEAIARHGAMILVTSRVTVCRDPKDNFLLALARDGDAHWLVTSDEDLLVLERYARARIVTPGRMRKELP